MQTFAQSKAWKFLKVFLLVLGILWMFILIFVRVVGYGRAVEIVAGLAGVSEDALIADSTEASNPALDEIQSNFYVYFFVASIIASSFGLFVLSQGRTLFEVVWLFVAFVIPPQKKDWGMVYDKSTKKPVSFATVRLFMQQDSNQVYVAQTITDLDGRYRLQVGKAETDMNVDVLADTYQPEKLALSKNSPEIVAKEIKVDVPLQKQSTLDELKSSWDRMLNEFKRRAYTPTIIFLYVFVIIGVIHSLYGLIAWPSPTAVISGSFYVGALIWNTYNLKQRFRSKLVVITDVETMQPISGANLKMYKDGLSVLSLISNAEGVVKIDLDPGKYQLEVMKSGYEMLSDGKQKLIDAYLNPDGTIDTKLVMRKTGAVPADARAEQDNQLASPFGG